MKRAAALLAALAACAHSKAQQAPASTSKNGVEVQDAIHGVRYQLPPGADLWQVSREGAARSTSGAEVEVSTLPGREETIEFRLPVELTRERPLAAQAS